MDLPGVAELFYHGNVASSKEEVISYKAEVEAWSPPDRRQSLRNFLLANIGQIVDSSPEQGVYIYLGLHLDLEQVGSQDLTEPISEIPPAVDALTEGSPPEWEEATYIVDLPEGLEEADQNVKRDELGVDHVHVSFSDGAEQRWVTIDYTQNPPRRRVCLPGVSGHITEAFLELQRRIGGRSND